MLNHYKQQGYTVVPKLFNSNQLDEIENVIKDFHQAWIEDNQTFYNNQAINSSGLTGIQYLEEEQRRQLFEFISSDELINVVKKIIPNPTFLNTQLFFDPVNIKQNNYWHRDIQYDLDIEEQKAVIAKNSSMPHFRIPLVSEKGIELIPRSHRRWDTAEELDVRLQRNGRLPHHNLPNGKIIEVKRGDLLIFSAKMLHRGIYGGNRFAFDVLFTEQDSPYLKHSPPDYLPSIEQLAHLPNKEVFERE